MKKNMSILHLSAALLIFYPTVCDGTTAASYTGCLDMNGNPVDWFIVYKIPSVHKTAKPMSTGAGFFYMDINHKSWETKSNYYIDQRNHAIYYTLQQIYDNNKSDFMYLMYNDKPPNGTITENYGHTKGVVAFDMNAGFWLVHSTPSFTNQKEYGYLWPKNAYRNGQTFLCVTYPYATMNAIGKQLKYNFPQIYDKTQRKNLPAKMINDNPDMVDVLYDESKMSRPPWNHTETLFSKGGNKFVSFAKYKKFDLDLYHDWLAPALGSNLLVETWQDGGGKLHSDCSGNYKVFNIKAIRMSKQVRFSETKDHSKWAFASSKKWICIGDINRQEHQMKRAGGTVCFVDQEVWNQFHSIINGIEQCSNSS